MALLGGGGCCHGNGDCRLVDLVSCYDLVSGS